MEMGVDMAAPEGDKTVQTEIPVKDPNRGREAEVGITFMTRDFTKEQWEALWTVQKLLNEVIGVRFDTGYSMVDGGRDWEWDWSLSGPVKVTFRRWTDEYPEKNRYSERMKKIREGTMPPEFYQGAQNDNRKDRLDNITTTECTEAGPNGTPEISEWGAVGGYGEGSGE